MEDSNKSAIGEMIRTFLIILFIILISIASIAVYERDLSRNFQKYGDAKAWFYPIRVDK